MFKHSLVSKFFQITFTEIKILQLKEIWKEMISEHVKDIEKTFILIT